MSRIASAQDLAHVLPSLPKSWGYPASATVPRTYTLLNNEAPEFVRFINPATTESRVKRAARVICRSFRRQSAA